jgi:23S rRNA (adenine2503-C2)-methyltransferase
MSFARSSILFCCLFLATYIQGYFRHFRHFPCGKQQLSVRGSSSSLLTETFDSLRDKLHGTGKAKMFWNYLREGKDISNPETFQTTGLSSKTFQNITNLLCGHPLIDNTIVSNAVSPCGTRKLLLKLLDGMEIETVLIPSTNLERTTLCVSTQVGCDRGCAFCRTGKMGLIRNLTASEIIGQVIRGIQISRQESMPMLRNVVFMGMGDAGRNLNAVNATVHCLTDPWRFSLKRSRVTVSTVGPALDTFSTITQWPCTLAWSLHSPNEQIRRFLVPSARHSPLELRESLIQAIQQSYQAKKGRTLMLAITLIQDINDRIEDAEAVSAFVRPILQVIPKIAIDLIPYNDIHTHGFMRPSHERICAFQHVLRQDGYFCSVRITRGDEENAACGMLATSSTKRQLKANNRDVVSL